LIFFPFYPVLFIWTHCNLFYLSPLAAPSSSSSSSSATRPTSASPVDAAVEAGATGQVLGNERKDGVGRGRVQARVILAREAARQGERVARDRLLGPENNLKIKKLISSIHK
jgi:hypothetical protein